MSDLTGKQQQAFTAWLASLPDPPLRQDKAWAAWCAGWKASGAEKLRLENAELKRHLNGR